MSRCCSFIKDFILRADLFSTIANLRIKGQPNYQTYFGGAISLVVIIFFIIVFANSFIQVVTKVNINSITQISQELNSVQTIDSIYFAVGLQGYDLTVGSRYFDFALNAYTFVNGTQSKFSKITLQPCKIQSWKSIDSTFQSSFNAFKMNKMLCPVSHNFSLQGHDGSDLYEFIELSISKCTNNSIQANCYPQSTINTTIDNHLLMYDYLLIEFYIVDTAITPNSDSYISKILEKQIFLSFTHNMGSKGSLRFGYYQISTDQSIFPISSIQQQSGHYVQSYETHQIEIRHNHYCKFVFQKSTKEQLITRDHGKIDNMLSYIGGLFGLILVVIAFFIGQYSEYKYEIFLSQGVSKHEPGTNAESFHFYTYLKYKVYEWIRYFGCDPGWNKMRQIHQIRQQGIQHIDTKLLLHKITYLQNLLRLLLNDDQRLVAHLILPPTHQQLKKQREIFEQAQKILQQKDDNQILQQIMEIFKGNQIHNIQKNQFESASEFSKRYEIDQQNAYLIQIIQNIAKKAKNQNKQSVNWKIMQLLPEKIRKMAKRPISRHLAVPIKLKQQQYRQSISQINIKPKLTSNKEQNN